MARKKAQEINTELLTTDELVSMRESLEKEIPGLFWGDDEDLEVVNLPLGIHSVDEAMNGGLPFSRISMLYGDQAAGKTTLALLFIAAAQKLGLACAFLDIEKKLDPQWAKAIGVDIENLVVARPRSAELAANALSSLVEKNFGVVVIDSIAALASQAELEADGEKKFMGEQARISGQIIKVINAKNNKTLIIMINQVREKIGVMFGNPETIPGGRAQRYYPTVIVRVRRGEYIDEGTGDKKAKIGYNLRVVVEKDQHGAPFKEASVPFYFTGKIDEEAALVATALALDVITQRGAFYFFGEERWQGKAGLTDAIKADENLKQRISEALDAIQEVDI